RPPADRNAPTAPRPLPAHKATRILCAGTGSCSWGLPVSVAHVVLLRLGYQRLQRPLPSLIGDTCRSQHQGLADTFASQRVNTIKRHALGDANSLLSAAIEQALCNLVHLLSPMPVCMPSNLLHRDYRARDSRTASSMSPVVALVCTPGTSNGDRVCFCLACRENTLPSLRRISISSS